MLDILAGSELLTIMVVIALGTLVGIIPFGPVRIGPAGALFVGLAFGALDPRLGQGLDLIRPLGLALFVYTVGLASGSTFFSSLRRHLPVMLSAVVVLAFSTGLIIVVGKAMGLTSALQGGAFAGSLTSTPALAAATAKAGSNDPAVGYALTYPFGVVLTIVMVSIILNRDMAVTQGPTVDGRTGPGRPDHRRGAPHTNGGRTRVPPTPHSVLLPVPGRRDPRRAGRRSVRARRPGGDHRAGRTGRGGDRLPRTKGHQTPGRRSIGGRLPTHPDLQSADCRAHHRQPGHPAPVRRDHHQGPSRGHRVARQRRSGRRAR